MSIALLALLFSGFISLCGIWLGFWAEDNPSLIEEKKFKRKRIINIVSSILSIIALFISYKLFQEDKRNATQNLQLQLSSYRNIDTTKQIGIEANKAINSIRKKADTIRGYLDTLEYSYKSKSELMLTSLTRLNQSLERNVDSTNRSFSNLLSKSKELQYPIPKQINLSYEISWPVEGVDENILDVITKKSKLPLKNDYVYSDDIKFLIDSSFGVIYQELYLAFKKITITFKKIMVVVNILQLYGLVMLKMIFLNFINLMKALFSNLHTSLMIK